MSGCWLHPAARVRSSTIEGVGLFAAEPMRAGVPVSILDGEVVDTARLVELIGAGTGYVDTITIGVDRHLGLAPLIRSGGAPRGPSAAPPPSTVEGHSSRPPGRSRLP